MNIFVLHSDPRLAALYHCDQHLNKMIVESAQMLSTVLKEEMDSSRAKYLMKPAYSNHPCTIWTGWSPANSKWLCQMAMTLEKLRDSSRENAASPVIRLANDWLEENYPLATWQEAAKDLIFCGPADLKQETSFSTVTKYRALYIRKFLAWQQTAWKMSYSSRVLPEFLEPHKDSIPHALPPGKWNDEQLLSLFCEA
jgi:hypothetical protein